MQTEEQNYGMIGEHGVNPASMSAQQEKSWSILAHLSLFLNLFTGFLGPVAALVIWLVYKDRARRRWRSTRSSRCGTRWRGSWC